jgi:hypothetical protein
VQELCEKLRAAGCEWDRWAEIAERAHDGLLRTPCDVIHDPLTAADAVTRILACIPSVSPFQTLENAREDLNRALAQYLKSSALKSMQSEA